MVYNFGNYKEVDHNRALCPIGGGAKIRPGQVSSKIMLFPHEHSRELQINANSESAI